jgi:hypothetical protein
MNVRPVVGSGESALNVDFWVFPDATRIDKRSSAVGQRQSQSERLSVDYPTLVLIKRTQDPGLQVRPYAPEPQQSSRGPHKVGGIPASVVFCGKSQGFPYLQN